MGLCATVPRRSAYAADIGRYVPQSGGMCSPHRRAGQRGCSRSKRSRVHTGDGKIDLFPPLCRRSSREPDHGLNDGRPPHWYRDLTPPAREGSWSTGTKRCTQDLALPFKRDHSLRCCWIAGIGSPCYGSLRNNLARSGGRCCEQQKPEARGRLHVQHVSPAQCDFHYPGPRPASGRGGRLGVRPPRG
jgi:hypothetical protein